MISIFKKTKTKPLTLKLIKTMIFLNIINIIILILFIIIASAIKSSDFFEFIDYVIANKLAHGLIVYSVSAIVLFFAFTMNDRERPIYIFIPSFLTILDIFLSITCLTLFFMR